MRSKTATKISASRARIGFVDIHRAYLEAGADIIETNSFQGSPIVLAEFGIEDKARELNVLAAQLARQAADEFSTTAKPRFVAGSIGPTTKSITLRGDVTFQQLSDSYYVQAQGLVEGGVDVLLLETGFDTRNIKAGLFAIRKLERELGIHIPLMISGTIERWGAMLAGQPVDAFCASVSHANLLSIGLNCATGPDLMTDHIRTLGPDGSDAHLVLSERRAAERRRQVSGDAGIARRTAREIRRAWLAEYRGRLLRNHAGAYPRHRANGGRQGSAS